MGISTISMAIFNSKLLAYQAGYITIISKCPTIQSVVAAGQAACSDSAKRLRSLR